MSLLKKITSLVCTVGMLSTMSAMFVNVQAADPTGSDPTIKAEVTSYNNETGEGVITVSVKGVQTGESDIMEFTGFNARFRASAEDFDTSLYSRVGNAIRNNVEPAGPITSLAYSYYGILDDDVFAATASSQSVAEEDAFDLMTVNFKVLDTTKDNTMTLYYAKYIANPLDSGWMPNGQQVTYYMNGQPDGLPLDTDRYLNVVSNGATEGTGGGEITITIPANGESSASTEAGSLVSITPADLGLEGDVWTTDDPEFAGEEAVAALGNFEPLAEGAATTVLWTVSYTPVGGETSNVVMNFDLELGGIESNTTLGLIVGYDTAEYSDVSIVSGTLQ